MRSRGGSRFHQDLWPEDTVHAGPLPLHQVAGVDEAGRGPLAGPVVAAAVVLQVAEPALFPGLDDSKKISRDDRERLFALLTRDRGDLVAGYGIGLATPEEIDQTDILRATELAAARALRQLRLWPELLLTDALTLREGPWQGRQVPLVKGDGRCLCIAAASVLAKVTRDRIMENFDREYLGYGFARHFGYPTPEHYRALDLQGPCAIHRRSFLKD